MSGKNSLFFQNLSAICWLHLSYTFIGRMVATSVESVSWPIHINHSLSAASTLNLREDFSELATSWTVIGQMSSILGPHWLTLPTFSRTESRLVFTFIKCMGQMWNWDSGILNLIINLGPKLSIRWVGRNYLHFWNLDDVYFSPCWQYCINHKRMTKNQLPVMLLN